MAVVIGIVKARAVRLDESRAANGVIKNALHAIAVTRVARHAQQIARNLKVAIGSARRLETGMRALEARREGPSSRLHKRFIWSPRSEERRVGKEWRSRAGVVHFKQKTAYEM